MIIFGSPITRMYAIKRLFFHLIVFLNYLAKQETLKLLYRKVRKKHRLIAYFLNNMSVEIIKIDS